VTKSITALLSVLLFTVLSVSATAQTRGPTQAELSGAAANAADWLHPNHDYGGQRFVELGEINRANVRGLSPVCRFEAGDMRPFHTHPIVQRGVMYITTTYTTFALDAATCHVHWRHDWQPKAQQNWPQQRGVAIKDGKVVRGTLDGYLLALDAETGQILWERAAADATKGETFTMPPLIYENLVIIGPAGNEVAVKGWVGAFRLDTGEPVWRFSTFPAQDEPGSETWSATDALTGGGAVWTPFSLDPREGRVYIATGNPAPDYYGEVRQGDNLYTNALVVLDVRTGKLVWQYQATPHDTHDWDLTQASPLFTAEVKSESRRLVTVTGKDGLLRVFDRETRELIYEVAVTRRENGTAPVTVEGVYACPGPLGGVQWNGPAFSPRTNMLYIPAVDWCGTYKKAEELRHVQGRLYMGGSFAPDPVDQMRGWLTAIDAASGTVRWRYQSSQPMVAAVTATSADLIFTGELNGDLIVLDGRDGSVLYRFNTGGAISGGIVTYQVGGKQYIAVTSGAATRFWRVPPAPSTIVVFSLPKNEN
jgi:PQQ-dependent dehydrogenase (methanol/ethanol family)